MIVARGTSDNAARYAQYLVLALRWAQLRGPVVDAPPGLTKVTETY